MVPSFIQTLSKLVFPPVCVLCDQPLMAGECHCDPCRRELDLLRSQPACPTCASSPGPHMSPDGYCGQCRSKKVHFDGSARVAPYKKEMVTLLLRFKYGRAEYLDQLLADLMSCSLSQAPWRHRIEAIVPVPTHWLRRFTTGFNTVEVLSRRIARLNNLPWIPLLQRVRLDPHQVGLSYTQRIKNVKGAFGIKPGAKIANARICVIDDVMTTGATLDEVSKVLKQAGAAEVWNLMLARAGPQDAALSRA